MASGTLKQQPYKPQWYKSPIDIPEKKSGKLSIRHKMIEGTTAIVSMRQAIFTGKRPISATLVEPLRIHELYDEDNGVWMTDLPQELNQMAEVIHNHPPFGRVLVGGLGLGIFPTWIAKEGLVDTVDVIELSRDVINLVASEDTSIFHSDIRDYLKNCGDQYDCIYLDTWQGTSESTWWDTVLPLRRIIANRWEIRPQVQCWAEDIMLGQVIGSAERQCRIAKEHPEIQGVPGWNYKIFNSSTTVNEIKAFTKYVGQPAWEKRWGKAVDALHLGEHRDNVS